MRVSGFSGFHTVLASGYGVQGGFLRLLGQKFGASSFSQDFLGFRWPGGSGFGGIGLSGLGFRGVRFRNLGLRGLA